MHTARGLTGAAGFRNSDKPNLAVEPGKVFHGMHVEGVMTTRLHQPPHHRMCVPMTAVDRRGKHCVYLKTVRMLPAPCN